MILNCQRKARYGPSPPRDRCEGSMAHGEQPAGVSGRSVTGDSCSGSKDDCSVRRRQYAHRQPVPSRVDSFASAAVKTIENPHRQRTDQRLNTARCIAGCFRRAVIIDVGVIVVERIITQEAHARRRRRAVRHR